MVHTTTKKDGIKISVNIEPYATSQIEPYTTPHNIKPYATPHTSTKDAFSTKNNNMCITILSIPFNE